jgi:hypothetical protein
MLLRAVYFTVPMKLFGAGIFPKDVHIGQPDWGLQFSQYTVFFAAPNVRGRGEGRAAAAAPGRVFASRARRMALVRVCLAVEAVLRGRRGVRVG